MDNLVGSCLKLDDFVYLDNLICCFLVVVVVVVVSKGVVMWNKVFK